MSLSLCSPVFKFVENFHFSSPSGPLSFSLLSLSFPRGFQIFSLERTEAHENTDKSGDDGENTRKPPFLCNLIGQNFLEGPASDEEKKSLAGVRFFPSAIIIGVLVILENVETGDEISQNIRFFSLLHNRLFPFSLSFPGHGIFSLFCHGERLFVCGFDEISVFSWEFPGLENFSSSAPLDRLSFYRTHRFPAFFPRSAQFSSQIVAFSHRFIAFPGDSANFPALAAPSQSPAISPLLRAQNAQPQQSPALPPPASTTPSTRSSFSLLNSSLGPPSVSSLSSMARVFLSATSAAVTNFLAPNTEIPPDFDFSQGNSGPKQILTIRDLYTGKYISHTFIQGNSISALAFSPNGENLAVSDENGQFFQIFALVPSSLGENLGNSLQGPGLRLTAKLFRGISFSTIHSLSFSSDSRYFTACTGRGTTHFYDLMGKSTEMGNSIEARVKTIQASKRIKFPASSDSPSCCVSAFLSFPFSSGPVEFLGIFNSREEFFLYSLENSSAPGNSEKLEFPVVAHWAFEEFLRTPASLQGISGGLGDRDFSSFLTPVEGQQKKNKSSALPPEFPLKSQDSFSASLWISPQFDFSSLSLCDPEKIQQFLYGPLKARKSLGNSMKGEDFLSSQKMESSISQALASELPHETADFLQEGSDGSSLNFQEFSVHFPTPEKDQPRKGQESSAPAD